MSSSTRSSTRNDSETAKLLPRRLALKFTPPTVILEYVAETVADAPKAFMHYHVRLRNLDALMDAEKITGKLFARHPRHFDATKVKPSQVKKLVERLLAHAIANVSSDESCDGAKGTTSSQNDGPDELDVSSASGLGAAPLVSPSPDTVAPPAAGSFASRATEDEQRLLNGEVNLNAVSAFTLTRAKSLMDVDFERHSVAVGDEKYVYDKQVEFDGGEDDCGWDD